jgi:hypothetical protein
MVEPIPTFPVVTLIDDVLTIDAAFSELTASVEKALAPEPVPGSNPLILDTVSVDAVMAGAVILVVSVNVLPVRVDKSILAALREAIFDEYNVR